MTPLLTPQKTTPKNDILLAWKIAYVAPHYIWAPPVHHGDCHAPHTSEAAGIARQASPSPQQCTAAAWHSHACHRGPHLG